jgi:hypothetical protein
VAELKTEFFEPDDEYVYRNLNKPVVLKKIGNPNLASTQALTRTSPTPPGL